MRLQTVKLGDIAIQDKVIVPPDSVEALIRPYLGLDQIEAQTGKIISYDSTSTEGKSTAFAFNGNHVLYGKL
jgi:type I restriction enzyme S subunit